MKACFYRKNLDSPNIIFGEGSKSRKHYLQYFLTTCPLNADISADTLIQNRPEAISFRIRQIVDTAQSLYWVHRFTLPYPLRGCYRGVCSDVNVALALKKPVA